MISYLIEAAMVARRASIDSPDRVRTIEIVLSEIGLVVRGKDVTAGSAKHASTDLDWPDFEARPDLLTNSVNLCLDALGTAERGGS